MLSRLAANPRLRASLLVAVLALCGYGLYSEWPAVAAQLSRLHWYMVVLSLAAAVAGNVCMMLAWRAILADLGSPLRVAAAARVNFLAQLGKYVPGAVWAFAAQVELGNDLGVPRRRGAASVVVSLAVMIGTGLTVAAVTLPLASPATARQYWPVMAVIPVLLICLYPPVLGWLLRRALAVLRMPPLEQPPTARGLVRALAFNYLGWLMLGIQVWLLAVNLTGRGADILLLATGGYALAFSAGLLLVVVPGGIGARDLVLIAALTTAIPHHAVAVAVAVITRAVATVGDLLCGAIGLALGGRARKGTSVGRHRLASKPWAAPETVDQGLGSDRAAF